MALMPLVASLLVLGIGIVAIFYLVQIGKKNHAALMGIVPVIGASGAFVSLVFFLKRIPWRHGRIVPARVIMPTFGGGVDGVGVALGVLGAVVPVGGAVASAFGGSEAPTRIQLEWVDGGLVHAGTPANAVDSEIDRADITVWLIIGREPRLLDAVAPPEYRHVPVPREIDSQLREALRSLPTAPKR